MHKQPFRRAFSIALFAAFFATVGVADEPHAQLDRPLQLELARVPVGDLIALLTHTELESIRGEIEDFRLLHPEATIDQLNVRTTALIHEEILNGVEPSMEQKDSYIPTAYYKLNPLEKDVCLIYPYYCIKSYPYAQAAIDAAGRHYPGATSLVDGKGDAFRHAYWNVLMVRGTSLNFAKAFSSAHEVGDPGNLGTKQFDMDVYNNAQGQYIGKNAPSSDTNTKLQDRVKSYVTDGKLVIIKNGKLVRSNS